MSDEDLRDQTHQRWQETLALLGLPPEPEPPPAAPAPVAETQAPEPEPQKAYAPEPARTPERPEEPRTHTFGEGLFSEPAFEPLAASHEEEHVAEPAPPEAAGAEDEDRARRRGRRGGRGRSFRAAVETPASAAETAPAEAEGEGEPKDERGRGRSRGRGRRRDVEEAEPPEVVEDQDEPDAEVVPEEAASEPEEEPDTLSDWNVPSWQDLIASLYRPDR